MSLKITKLNGTYFANGQLNSTTERTFMIYFGCVIAQNQSVIVNMDGVTKMDADGLEAIKKLITVAEKNNKSFLVIGSGYEQLYQDTNSSKVA